MTKLRMRRFVLLTALTTAGTFLLLATQLQPVAAQTPTPTPTYTPTPTPHTHAHAHGDTDTDADAEPFTVAKSESVADADRLRFERQFDRRPCQSALQPDDH